MALFKINKGKEVNLPTTLTEGWAYFTTDDHNFYIDYKDSSNTLVRSKISSEYSDKLRYRLDGNTIEIDPADIATKAELNNKLNKLNPEADGSLKVAGTFVDLSVTPDDNANLKVTVDNRNDLITKTIDFEAATSNAPYIKIVNQADSTTKEGYFYTEFNPPPVDSALSTTSTNPVENKAVHMALASKANKTSPIIDNKLIVQTGTANNANATMPSASIFPASDGTYITFDHPTKIPTSLRIKDQSLYLEYDDVEYKVYPPTIDTALSRTSTNPVQNKMVFAALDTKVNTTEATVNENFVVVGSDYLTTGRIETDSSGKVTFMADNSMDYTYQSIVLDSLNSDMPKLQRGSVLTGETEEGYFYTELNPQIQTGTYSGNGSPKQYINLGKRPKFVYVSPMNGATTQYSGEYVQIYGGLALDGYPLQDGSVPAVEITDTGFTVDQDDNYTNQVGTSYYYIWG